MSFSSIFSPFVSVCFVVLCRGIIRPIPGSHLNSPVASANVCVSPFVHFALKPQPNRHILYAIWRKFKYFPSFLLFSFTVFHFESSLLAYTVVAFVLPSAPPPVVCMRRNRMFNCAGAPHHRDWLSSLSPLFPHFHLVAHQFKDLCLRF